MSNTSSGTLPNGETYAETLANGGDDELLLGGGYLYFMNLNGLTSMPDDSTIETSGNNVGDCSGGFKINYKPKTTKVYNQFDQLIQTFITREDFSVKCGILTWNLDNIANFSNATLITTNGDKRVVFTGGGSLDKFLVRFVHTKPNGGKIRFTMVGQGGTGFNLEFGTKPTTVNSELNAIQYFNNFLAEVREELESTNSNSNTP